MKYQAPHKFCRPPFKIHLDEQAGRNPETWQEWRAAIWYADVFFGPIPAFKATILICTILAVLIKVL